jgi:hypothetical protein
VEEHLVTFYGQNYMHDDPLWNWEHSFILYQYVVIF